MALNQGVDLYPCLLPTIVPGNAVILQNGKICLSLLSCMLSPYPNISLSLSLIQRSQGCYTTLHWYLNLSWVKNMPDPPIYEERLTSSFTADFFGLLTILFFALFIWRASLGDAGFLSILSLCLFLIFLFYSLNYRVLRIRLTPQVLTLRFGIFEWDVPVDGIRSCSIDETSPWRIGGAGIHFSFFKGNYRAMFNFLEYSRVVLTLKQKRGPVCEIAFSTNQPEQVIHVLTKIILEKRAA